ncbi:MAG: hypothetical protein V1872_03715 [bacterium]
MLTYNIIPEDITKHRFNKKISKKTAFIVFSLLLISLLFRCWAVRYAHFVRDEARFWGIARGIALGKLFPLLGPSLSGTIAKHPGPLFYYLMAIPQLLGASPFFGSIFVAILHVFSGWLLFLLVRQIRGDRAGIIALILFAFAPWDVVYADRIWLSCVAPVWATVTLYGATRFHLSPKWQVIFIVFALTLPQFHMSAPFIWIGVIVMLLLNRPVFVSKKALIIGVILVIFMYCPMIYYESTHNLSNLKSILGKGTGQISFAKSIYHSLKVFGYTFLFSTSEFSYHLRAGEWGGFNEIKTYFTLNGWKEYLTLHKFWTFFYLISIFTVLFAWIKVGLRLRKNLSPSELNKLGKISFEDKIMLMLFTCIITNAIFIVLARKPYYPHYSNLLIPMIFIPLTLFIDSLFNTRHLSKINTVFSKYLKVREDKNFAVVSY